MSEAWTSYRGAPRPGTRVCALSLVPDGGTLCLELAGFPLLLVRAGGLLRAFVNACPHQYLPLDRMGDGLISPDGITLRCTNHSAAFSVETGQGVAGFGLGACLDVVPVHVRERYILIGEAP